MGEFASNLGCMPPLPATNDMPEWLQLCFALTKPSEGCRLKAYPDPEPGGICWTVGYGATGHGIGPGTVWTQDEADADLVRRLKVINSAVTQAVRVRLSPGQRAALVDFAYNVGVGAFVRSTLLRKLNDGDYEGAAKEFARWKYDDGKVLAGLVTRRANERDLFLRGMA